MSVTAIHLFTDIEGSTRLWEEQPERMRAALAAHDTLGRDAVTGHRGRLIKTTGDGLHAVFEAPADALAAVLELQRALQAPVATAGLALSVRCGLHAGADEARDNDYFGRDVNRAARIMAAAHGGQVLVSERLQQALQPVLPPGVRLLELGSVRLRDLAQPERLYQVQAEGLRASFPPLRGLAEVPHNLPPQLSRFIGRDDELARLRELVRGHRLVTLWGPGGIGKSRLSLELAADLLPGFVDGAWLVELAAVADGQQLPQAVAAVLGVKEAPGQDLLAALARHVADRRMLLVLDNCEHVHAAAAALAKRLLQAGPGLQLLASSRELLHVAGEQAFAVPALSTPRSQREATPAQLLPHAAVRLFIDRAQAAQPAFRLDAGNAAAVAEICQRLDGLPLAIELAAARTRALPLAALAQRLRDSFALVATRDQTVAPRQRTLDLLIDWSHDLLDEAERCLYRRLSVFAGSFGLEAAEAVCAEPGLDATELTDLLSQLVDKSLVAALWQDDGHTLRYRLLDTVRRHAAQRLQAADEADAVRAAHARWYTQLAESSRPRLAGAGQGEVLARLDAERDNLLAALSFAADTGGAASVPARADADARARVELGLRLSFALRPYWFNRGQLSLAVLTTQSVLAHPAAAARDALRARGLFDAGQLCSFMGHYPLAKKLLEESLDIARATHDLAREAAVLQPLGMAALGLGDHAAARRHGEAAIAAARALGNNRQLAGALNALAQLDRSEGRLDDALRLYQEFMRLARSLADPDYLAVGLLNLSMVALARHEPGTAIPMLREAVAVVQANGSRPAALGVLDVCTGLAVLQGDFAAAAERHGLAEAEYPAAGLQRDPADAAFLEPLLARARARLGDAAYRAAEAEGRAQGFETGWQRLCRALEADQSFST